MTQFSSQSALITLPITTDTLVGKQTTDVLANKTMDSGSNTITITNSPLSAANVNTLLNQALLTSSQPSFVSITAALGGQGSLKMSTGGTNSTTTTIVPNQSGNISITLPSSATRLIGFDTTDTLTNKSFNNTSCLFVDNADNTKKIAHSSSGNTTGITLTLAAQQSTSQTLSFPNISGSDTIATLAANNLFTGLNTYNFQSTGASGTTSLGFYEYFQQATTMSGVWASSQNITFTIERLGNRVTIGWPAVTATSNSASVITVAFTFPSRLRPTDQVDSACAVFNGAIVNGLVEMSTAGVMKFFGTVAGGNFSSGVGCGTTCTSMTYFITQ